MHVKYNTSNGHVVRVSETPFDMVEVGFSVAQIQPRSDDSYAINPRDEITHYISVNEVDEDNFVTSYTSILQSPEAVAMIDSTSNLKIESAMIALELIDTQIALEQSQNEQASLLLLLIDTGVI